MSIPATLRFLPLDSTPSWPKITPSWPIRAQEFVINSIKSSSSKTPKWEDIARRLNNHMARNEWEPKKGKQVRERYCEHLDPEVRISNLKPFTHSQLCLVEKLRQQGCGPTKIQIFLKEVTGCKFSANRIKNSSQKKEVAVGDSLHQLVEKVNLEAHSDKSICSITRKRFFKVNKLSADDIAEKIKKIPHRVGLKRTRADKERVFSKPKSKKPKSKKPKSVAATEPPKPLSIEGGPQLQMFPKFKEDGLFDDEGNCQIRW